MMAFLITLLAFTVALTSSNSLRRKGRMTARAQRGLLIGFGLIALLTGLLTLFGRGGTLRGRSAVGAVGSAEQRLVKPLSA